MTDIVTTRCDTCKEIIEDQGIGVDIPSSEEQLHFCSTECLTSWVLGAPTD